MLPLELNTGTGDSRLHIYVDGNPAAPPLLLLHSLGATSDLWSAQVAHWSQRFRVIRYDMRGHGQSAIPPGEYSLAALGEDAVRVLDAVGVDKAGVCGASIGGLTVMWLGVNRAERLAGAVIANAPVRPGTPERWNERIAKVRSEGMTAIADVTMTTWFTASFRERNPDVVARCHGMIAASNPDGYVGCCAAVRNADMRDELTRFAVPALVVAGDSDVTSPISDAVFTASRIPASTQITLPGAHMTCVEAAGEFSREAGRFFTAILGS